MKRSWVAHALLILSSIACVGALPLLAQDQTTTSTVPVRMTVTVRLIGENKRMPEVKREDVIVHQDKERLKVTGWTPARGDHAGLDLFILIDEATSPSLGTQLDDLRGFINGQPATTSLGVGYMRNATVQIVQNFTTERAQAAKALRLPIASASAYGSPYLSVIDLMKRWPADTNRRVVLMITDGIDRARGGPRFRLNYSPDVDSASAVAQRTGTLIYSILTRGIGHLGNNFWEITNGQNGLAKLAEDTGGESYYLSTSSPVSFKPYLEELQKSLDNQYLLEFRAIPGKKSGLQNITLSTEVAGVELDAADSVWVEAKGS